MSRYDLIPVHEALAIVRSVIVPLETETVATAVADGRVLAQDVISPEHVPPFRASTVDGFAVIAADDLGPSQVVENITAGVVGGAVLQPGMAARIMTGAPLPEGADAVAMIEYARQDGVTLTLERAVRVGENIRPVGVDVTEGDRVLERGAVLGPAEIGLLMTLGFTAVTCYRQPIVGVLSTGDELVEPDQPVPPGGIRDSNRYAIMAAIREAGGVPRSLGQARDDRDLQTKLVREGIAQVDVLITSGGVSVGDRDYIKPALEAIGKVHFGRIAFRPGMPLTFAQIGQKVAFGLPGNPVSSLVTFEAFVRPALRMLQGDPNPSRPEVDVELLHDFQAPGARLEYHRVVVRWSGGRLVAQSTGLQLSSRLLSMTGHNGMLILDPGDTPIRAGERRRAILTGPIQV